MNTRQENTRQAVEKMRTEPAEFRRHVLVDVNGRPRRFADVMKPWQRRDFEALDPAWQRAIGLDVPEPQYNRALLLRGRGCSKTNDIAVAACWALWAAPRAITGIAGAGSKEQGALIVKAIRKLLRLNPWLSSVLDVQRFVVRNKRTGSELSVIAADAGLAMGHLCDFVLADELAAWDAGGEELWHVLFSTVGKRENCLLAILSNSGVLIPGNTKRAKTCGNRQAVITRQQTRPRRFCRKNNWLNSDVYCRRSCMTVCSKIFGYRIVLLVWTKKHWPVVCVPSNHIPSCRMRLTPAVGFTSAVLICPKPATIRLL